MASRRQGESLNLIPLPAASRREGISRGLGFVLTFINLTTCANSGHVGPHQSDSGNSPQSPGSHGRLLLDQEPPGTCCCCSRAHAARLVCRRRLPACSAADTLIAPITSWRMFFFFFLAGFQLGVEERLMCGKSVRPLRALRVNVALA